jgi:hypothetical protein
LRNLYGASGRFSGPEGTGQRSYEGITIEKSLDRWHIHATINRHSCRSIGLVTSDPYGTRQSEIQMLVSCEVGFAPLSGRAAPTISLPEDGLAGSGANGIAEITSAL